MHSDFDPHVIDNPPMPYEQYRDKAIRTFAKQVVILVSAVLFGCAVAALMNALKWGW